MTDRTEGPRPIETLVDVDAILGSPKASFEELLDCARLSRALGAWDRVETAAVRAVESLGGRGRTPQSIDEAIRLVLRARLASAGSIEELPVAVAAATELLDDLAVRVARPFKEARDSLAELTLLIADGEPASMVRLCSRLRKFERPDLGVAAATRAMTEEGTLPAALTTRGAAHLDMDHLPEAEGDLLKAWALVPSVYTALALARYWLRKLDSRRAIEFAREVVNRDPDLLSGWAQLLAAAGMAGDVELEDYARAGLLRTAGEPQSLFGGTDSPYPVYLAADQLFQAGRYDEAEAAILSLVSDGYTPAVKLEKKISLERRKVTPKTGGQPDDSNAAVEKPSS